MLKSEAEILNIIATVAAHLRDWQGDVAHIVYLSHHVHGLVWLSSDEDIRETARTLFHRMGMLRNLTADSDDLVDMLAVIRRDMSVLADMLDVVLAPRSAARAA